MSFFKNKTVGSIVNKLTTTVLELEVHAEEQKAKAELQKAAAEAAHLAHEAHLAEHALAVKVSNNIKGLLGG